MCHMKTPKSTVTNAEQDKHKSCLFSVHGNSREMRRKRIETVAEQEPCLGFLAAVFDFEWMLRRAILALCDFPSPFIRKQMNRIHGTDGLKNSWDMFVCSGNIKRNKSLDIVLRDGTENVSVDWGDVCTAFKARHPIVHGDNGFIRDDDAKKHMQALLDASNIIEAHLRKFGKTAFDRIEHQRWPDGKTRKLNKLNAQGKKR